MAWPACVSSEGLAGCAVTQLAFWLVFLKLTHVFCSALRAVALRAPFVNNNCHTLLLVLLRRQKLSWVVAAQLLRAS